ncbi:MAG: SBBP repeat-containing protein, partial [Anaerolineae bacterium]
MLAGGPGGIKEEETHVTDQGLAIAVDGDGNAYVTGRTASTNFPGASNYGGGSFDAFVTKLNATGSSLVYSTYLG